MICISKCFLEYICEHKEILLSILTFFVALLTLCVTREIAFNQQWNTLVSEYRSTEFGVAVKSICDFYIDDCESDLKQIESKYKARYDVDMTLVKEGKIKMKDTIHFKRRLVSQYYWHLENSLGFCKCSKRNTLKKYFDENEMDIMAIVYEMNKAVDELGIYRKIVIDGDKSIETDNEPSLMNKYIQKLYERFKIIMKSKKKMKL